MTAPFATAPRRAAQVLRSGAIVASLLLGCLPALAAGGTDAAAVANGERLNVLERIQAPLNAVRSRVISWFRAEERAIGDEVGRFTKTLGRDISHLSALIGEAGFEVEHIGMGGGLVPDISMCLAFRRDITEAEEAALRARIDQLGGALGLIERRILLALLDIDDALMTTREDGFHLGGVEVGIDLLPSLTFSFVPEGESGC